VTRSFTRPLQVMVVDAARSDLPTPRAHARARAAQRREQERAARKKERRIRRWERWEQRDEEFRLHEQQGLSPPATLEDSSSEEEEEEEDDGGRVLPERWEPAPPSPRAAGAAREQAPGVGAGGPVAKRSTTEAARAAEVPVRVAEAPARVAEAFGGAAAATPAAPAVPVEPSRKRKCGFSTLR
jgi:hypothetical protein